MTTAFLARRLFSGGIRLPSPPLRLFSTSPGPDAFTSPEQDPFASPDDTSSRFPDRGTFTSPDETSSRQTRTFEPRLLEGGLDPGIYKAVLIGKVGQAPMQRTLKSGTEIVLFSLATGGIRNNRRPLPHERPEEYDARCAVQWHRVCVYHPRIVLAAMRIVQPGAMMYLEGNIETKVFADPATGVVRRIREIAIRSGGRLLYLGSDNKGPKLDDVSARGVGYF